MRINVEIKLVVFSLLIQNTLHTGPWKQVWRLAKDSVGPLNCLHDQAQSLARTIAVILLTDFMSVKTWRTWRQMLLTLDGTSQSVQRPTALYLWQMLLISSAGMVSRGSSGIALESSNFNITSTSTVESRSTSLSWASDLPCGHNQHLVPCGHHQHVTVTAVPTLSLFLQDFCTY